MKKNNVVVISLIFSILFGISSLSSAKDSKENKKPIPDGNSTQIMTPDRQSGEGSGPYKRLIIRGATLIDGTGAPPTGPVDIVIEGNKIVDVVSVGTPFTKIDKSRRPKKC